MKKIIFTELSVKDFALRPASFKPLWSRLFGPLTRRISGIVLIFGVLSFLTPCQAANLLLDPGHGGNDSGAKGKDVAEKQFTLLLAEAIADKLAPRHDIELTRTADLAVEPDDRAAKANHINADLMVSLHAAVPPYCGSRIAAVFFHDQARLAIPTSLSVQIKLAESESDRPAWSQLQTRHRHRSRQAAATLKQSLLSSGAFDQVSVSGAPLAPLMGADLPAVLLEVGCLRATATSATLLAEQELAAYAEAIAAAIEAAVAELSP